MSSIWEKLSAIDCSEHVEKKGQFSYLAWTWAWAMVKQNYSQAFYLLENDTVYSDGTMEVRVTVCIPTEDPTVAQPLSHTMWLPVLDFKNKAIQNPNAFDINSARMRCLVKCLAMFGLGHYIYAGESAPQEVVITFTDDQKARYIKLMAEGDSWGMKKFFDTVGGDVMNTLFNAAPKGEITKQKDIARGLIQSANAELKAFLAAIRAEIDEQSATSIEEAFESFNPIERAYIDAALTEVEHKQIDDLLNTL